MTVEFIQWSPLSGFLIVSDEYGIIDGHVRFCLGDVPEYAAEGYPSLSVVSEDGRAVFCMPNGAHWWNAWAYRAPNPVIFEVDDNAIVYLGQIDHGKNQRVLARDALATLHRMLAQVDPGARYPGNFDVLVPLAALPENRYPRQSQQASAAEYTDLALACPPQENRQMARYSVPNNALYRQVYESLLEAYPKHEEEALNLLIEGNRLGISWEPCEEGYHLHAWNLDIHTTVRESAALMSEIEATIALARPKK